MVKRFLDMLHREITGLHQAAFLLAFFAVCSQVLALIRDRLLAAHFGASSTLDLYYSAFRIPDFLFATAASIVSMSVLVPFLLERMQKSDAAGKDFMDNIFSFFFLFMLVVGAVAFFLAPTLMRLLFPTFAKSPSQFSSLIALTRILLLSPIFLGFSNLVTSVTQVHRRFFIISLSPVLYNMGIIFGIIFLYPIFGLLGLGFGVAIGALLHFGIQIPFIVSKGMMPSLRIPKFSTISRVIYTSLPRTITVSSNELSELFLVSFASFLSAGSVSIFNFSFNLQSVPFNIIGVSYALAAFPTLAKFFNAGDHDSFVRQMITSSKHIIFWSIPVATMFIVLRAQIVRVILGSGQFNWNDTRLTAAALAIFTISLIAQNLITLFVRAFYSRGRTKTPLLMNVISGVIIVLSSYFLVHTFDHNAVFKNMIESVFKVSGVPGTVMLMLPLGFSIGVMFNLLLHWIGFSLEFPSYSRPVLRTLLEVTGVSVVMGYVAYLGLNIFDKVFNINRLVGIFSQGFFAGILGIIAGIILLRLLKNEELEEVWSTLHQKIWKATVIVPDASME